MNSRVLVLMSLLVNCVVRVWVLFCVGVCWVLLMKLLVMVLVYVVVGIGLFVRLWWVMVELGCDVVYLVLMMLVSVWLVDDVGRMLVFRWNRDMGVFFVFVVVRFFLVVLVNVVWVGWVYV